MVQTYTVLLTLVQIRNIANVLESEKNAGQITVFYLSTMISQEQLKKYNVLGNAVLIPFTHSLIYFSSFIKAPIMMSKSTRSRIAYFKSLIKDLETIEGVNLYIGSEKDLFTQVLIREIALRGDLVKLTAVEEGTGFYRKLTIKDRFLKLIYPSITKILAGFPYNYYSTLGTHPLISQVYCTNPSSIPYRKNRKYRKINLSSSEVSIEKVLKSNKLLFLTAPFAEKGKTSLERDKELVAWFIEFCSKNQYIGVIKKHPREDPSKYSGFKIEEIEQSTPAEEIVFDNYTGIIQYLSSTVIELLNRKYPSNRIITFNNSIDSFTMADALEDTIVIDLDCSQIQFHKALEEIKHP